jgi:ABC-type branched-subunit amino acid transport system substrate-binding protein
MGPDTNSWFFIASDFAFGHALERDAAAALEKLGGKVIGRVWPPFNNADFSSFLLRAQRSGASVIAFATAGQDTINLVKQAAEFGLAKPGTRVVPMQLMLDEVKAIGLPLGQGDYATMAFHHDRSPEARIWSVLKGMRGFARNKIGQGTDAAIARMLQQPATSFPGSRPLPPRGTGRVVGGALIPGRPGITGGRTAIGNLALLCGCL